MILAATPEERKHLPDQERLAQNWQRWVTGRHIPDAHREDPNVQGVYGPIIARMLGTHPRPALARPQDPAHGGGRPERRA